MTKHNEDCLKIQQQFRERRAMVYDLVSRSETLTLRIVPRADVTDAGDWRVEASSSGKANTPVICEWGGTPTAALRAVGRTWTSEASILGLPAIDWSAVEQELNTVRALKD